MKFGRRLEPETKEPFCCGQNPIRVSAFLPHFSPNWHLHNAFSMGVLKYFSGVVCGQIIAVRSSNENLKITWKFKTFSLWCGGAQPPLHAGSETPLPVRLVDSYHSTPVHFDQLPSGVCCAYVCGRLLYVCYWWSVSAIDRLYSRFRPAFLWHIAASTYRLCICPSPWTVVYIKRLLYVFIFSTEWLFVYIVYISSAFEMRLLICLVKLDILQYYRKITA